MRAPKPNPDERAAATNDRTLTAPLGRPTQPLDARVPLTLFRRRFVGPPLVLEPPHRTLDLARIVLLLTPPSIISRAPNHAVGCCLAAADGLVIQTAGLFLVGFSWKCPPEFLKGLIETRVRYDRGFAGDRSAAQLRVFFQCNRPSARLSLGGSVHRFTYIGSPRP